MTEDRARFVERQEPARSPEEARQRRAATMLGIGAIALVFALIATVNGGNESIALLIGVLGVGLLVGGLVIRR